MMSRSATETTAFQSTSSVGEDVDWKVKEAVLEILLATNVYTGKSYFQNLTKTLATYFHLEGAYLCQLVFDSEITYSPLAYWDELGTNRMEVFSQAEAYEVVIERGDIVQSNSAFRSKSGDKELSAFNVEALIGTVIRSESLDPIGALFLIDGEPVANAPFVDSVLQRIAPRVGAELEHYQQNIALRRSEARLRLVTESSKDVLFLYQPLPEMNVQFVSPAVEAIFGLPAEAFHANPELILDMVDPNDRASFKEALVSGCEEPLVAKVIHPDGGFHWIEYSGFSVQDDDEHAARMGGTARDVTKRVNAEKALESSERYLRTVLTSLPDTLFLLRSDGEVLDYIPGEVDLGFGKPVQVKGSNLKDLMSPAIVGALDRTIRATARSRRVHRVEFEVPGDKPRFFDARLLPFENDSLLLVLRDLTGLKWHEGEERRQEVRDELDHKVGKQIKSNPYGLTYRELAVLHLVVDGIADKQIADILGISIYTVNKHVGNVLGKMNAASRTEAGVRAVKEGLLDRSNELAHESLAAQDPRGERR